jgi:REP element-mobilizing transposase RayT
MEGKQRVSSPHVSKGSTHHIGRKYQPDMPKRDYIDFQARSSPLAYMITFRCYGTWLHGDERGSVDRRFYNRYGSQKIEPDAEKMASRARLLKAPPFLLGEKARKIVEDSVKEVCRVREYLLYAINVRTNHVHSVVSSHGNPERMMDSFKAYSTKALRAAGLLSADGKVWSRHGSTKYLWTEAEITNAMDYVLYSQGDELIPER